MQEQKDINLNPTEAKLQQSQQIQVKIEKLVTAIFMVTDYMDESEPIRSKLRGMCLEMLSSAHALNHSKTIVAKNEIMSLINVAKTIGLVSEMNAGILIRELRNSKDFIEQNFIINLQKLELSTPGLSFEIENRQDIKSFSTQTTKKNFSNEHNIQNRDLLSDVNSLLNKASKRHSFLTTLGTSNNVGYKTDKVNSNRQVVNDNKKDNKNELRKQMILNLIKAKPFTTITDIKMSISEVSEKTLQRDLLSLMNDGLIKKTGDKRWSKYSINK